MFLKEVSSAQNTIFRNHNNILLEKHFGLLSMLKTVDMFVESVIHYHSKAWGTINKIKKEVNAFIILIIAVASKTLHWNIFSWS